MPEINRTRDCIVFVKGERTTISVDEELVVNGWPGAIGVQFKELVVEFFQDSFFTQYTLDRRSGHDFRRRDGRPFCNWRDVKGGSGYCSRHTIGCAAEFINSSAKVAHGTNIHKVFKPDRDIERFFSRVDNNRQAAGFDGQVLPDIHARLNLIPFISRGFHYNGDNVLQNMLFFSRWLWLIAG